MGPDTHEGARRQPIVLRAESPGREQHVPSGSNFANYRELPCHDTQD